MIRFLLLASLATAQPLSLHPRNPHYFLFRGKPTILVTSAEHYGAVLNADFDYKKYLDTLARDGLNNTRTFTGAYVEPPGAFKIEKNTLAPAPGRLICPWARSGTPGYASGGNKFDLDRWDARYFARLKEFVAYAGKRGVVVEVNLFTPMYEDPQWNFSPMKSSNNVNSVGKVPKHEVYTTDKEPALLAVQEALTRKIVAELNDFDNLYYEVCNEPYFGGVTRAWHDRITDAIVAAEKKRKKKHLIAWNVANGAKKVEKPHPGISIFNFHYAPPEAVAQNYALNKVIGLNETGFKGTGDDYYRVQAWEFLLAGGGLFNNLDYSFTVGHEDGTFPVKAPTPGGGSARLRKQLRVLKEFLHEFDFVQLKPARDVVRDGVPKGVRVQALAEVGKQYLVYLTGGKQVTLGLNLPAGTYEGRWVDATTGKATAVAAFEHAGGVARVKSPAFARDFALRLVAR
jgi:hypothetical protein